MGGFTPLSCVLPLPHNPRSKSLNLDNLQRVFVVWVYNKIIFEGKGTKVDSSRLFPVAPLIGAHAPLTTCFAQALSHSRSPKRVCAQGGS